MMGVGGVVGSIQNHFTVYEYKANVEKKEEENGVVGIKAPSLECEQKIRNGK